jgi:hypothetical protein
MTFNVYYYKEHDCVVGVFKGKFDQDTANTFLREVLKIASEHGCKRFFSDMREAELALSTVEWFGLLELLDTIGFDRSWKRAIVVARDLETYRFFEVAALNRGYRIKIFTDLNDAKNWL